MEKLSKAGKLYLTDFYILNEARKDVEVFLNSVVEQVHNRFMENLDDLQNDYFQWGIWKNNSSPGHMRLYCNSKINSFLFRKGKTDIAIIYRDIRETSNLTNPASVQLLIWSPRVAKQLENEITKRSTTLFDENIYGRVYVEMDLEDVAATADKIVDVILDKCDVINRVIEGLVEEGQ